VLAPHSFPGALNGERFDAWLTSTLLPDLDPGMIVIFDNLPVHRRRRVRELIEDADCHVCYLPPSSPDVNPIEHLNAKLKTHLRSVAARDPETLTTAIDEGLEQITPQDIAGCYRHCGFPPPESP
jgi:transposase